MAIAKLDKHKGTPFVSNLFPVKSSEYAIFFPMIIIKLLASFNYVILNATKDTIIVTSSGAGAEIIPVLKGGFVLIVAFFIMLMVSRLSNKVSKIKLFHLIILSHLAFFLVFGLFLFPYRDYISPHKSANFLLNLIGNEHKHWVSVYRYWMNASFFILAEIWGGLVIGVLFWGFANGITSVKDAARLYALYSIGGHCGAFLAGMVLMKTSSFGYQNFETLIKILMLMVFCVGVLMMILFNYLQNVPFLTDKAKLNLRKSLKLSLKDSLALILRSKYLGFVAIMVIAYGLSINLVEVTWKAIVKIQYPDPMAYQNYMGFVQTFVGITSLLLALFFSSKVIKRYGWCVTAQATPIFLGITSLMFFIIYFKFPDSSMRVPVLLKVWGSEEFIKLTPLALLVFFGAVHNVVCKAFKYSVFDPTKEMTYIPLDEESKLKGKTAVDLVGARFGKSGASWLTLCCIDLVGRGSILGASYLFAPCLAVVICIWMAAVFKLNTLFKKQQLVKG